MCSRLQEISRRLRETAIGAGRASFSTGDANTVRDSATQRDIDEPPFHQGKVAIVQWIQCCKNHKEVEERANRIFLCCHKKERENVG